MTSVPVLIVEDTCFSNAITDAKAAMGFSPNIRRLGFEFFLHDFYSAIKSENCIGKTGHRIRYAAALRFFSQDLAGDAVVFMDCNLPTDYGTIDLAALGLKPAPAGLELMPATHPGVELAYRALQNQRFTGVVVFESRVANESALLDLRTYWPEHASRIDVVANLPNASEGELSGIISGGIDVFLRYKGCFDSLQSRIWPEKSESWFEE